MHGEGGAAGHSPTPFAWPVQCQRLSLQRTHVGSPDAVAPILHALDPGPGAELHPNATITEAAIMIPAR
jgi:hypothetical protein